MHRLDRSYPNGKVEKMSNKELIRRKNILKEQLHTGKLTIKEFEFLLDLLLMK